MSDVSLDLSEEAVFHKKILSQKTIYAKTAQNMEIAFPKNIFRKLLPIRKCMSYSTFQYDVSKSLYRP
jgi:hypothetical protein